jgi:hypothetical protein
MFISLFLFYSIRKINEMKFVDLARPWFGCDPIDKNAKFLSSRRLKKGIERERNRPQIIKLSYALEVI